MNAKRIAALLLLLCLMLSGVALGQEERIFDRAELFSASEEAALREQIASFQADTGMDFVILTSDEAHGDASQQTIADEFYERGGFGLDDDHSGVVYYIDMYDRQEYLSTTGAMIDYLTDERIEGCLDQSNPRLRQGAYAQAAQAMLSAVRTYIQRGIPEGQYRVDLITGQRLTARHKALTSGEVALGAVAGLVVAIIFASIVKSRYKLKGSTYRYDYQSNSETDITERSDDYLRTTTTRTRNAPPPSSGGGGGGGGGSSVHTSSSGTSHGGGGRGF